MFSDVDTVQVLVLEPEPFDQIEKLTHILRVREKIELREELSCVYVCGDVIMNLGKS